MVKKQNQIHTPRPQKKDQKYRAFYKSGDCTMLLAKNISYNAAKALEHHMRQFLAQHETKLQGTIIIVK